MGQPMLLGAFALACFLAAAWLVKGAQFWYFLLQNGLLLPAQLALIYACAQVGEPSRAGLEKWAKRLGTASLPLFILHVPAFTLFSRGEKLLASLWSGCDSGWSSCIQQASTYSLSPWLYPLFLLLTVALCLWAQRNAVVPMRTWLLRRLPVQRKQPSAA
jgi:peptidoglycan/LPS O-acetylase OafA/YrhL